MKTLADRAPSASLEGQTPQSSESTDPNENNLEQQPSYTKASDIWDVEYIIENCPIIDNHAHPLLKKQTSEQFAAAGSDLLTITSEAEGEALKHASTTLSHRRAFNTLRKDFAHRTQDGLDNWEEWKKFRDDIDEESFTEECFSGLQTILLDDGIRFPDETPTHDIGWHDQFLRSPAKRIVRLETIFEDLMVTSLGSFVVLNQRFFNEIRIALADPNIAGFKSVIAYRAGFDIPLAVDLSATFNQASNSFSSIYQDAITQGPKFQINDQVLNAYILNVLAVETIQHVKNGHRAKPLQLHTGFGDKDLDLKNTNPTLLKDFIEAYPELPIVLLHASYPYTREAGHLASVYPNVYLDFGLIFPKLSQEGQEGIVKQVFELTPSSKAMWSTDGVRFGETYYLGVKQIRAALNVAAKNMIAHENISFQDVSDIVQDVLFNTANKTYGLKLELYIPSPVGLPQKMKTGLSSFVANKPHGHRGMAALRFLKDFLKENPSIEYIRLNWVDYSAIVRTRILKAKHVIKQLQENENGSVIGVTQASLYLLANCATVVGGGPVGEWRLVPDFASIRLHPHRHDGEAKFEHASVMCWIEDDDQKRVDICPRNVLANSLDRAANAGLRDFKIGFEIEFVMLKQSELDNDKELVPISSTHTWSTSQAFQTKALVILEGIDRMISKAGIEVEQFHSEAAKGQYEIVVSPLPPLQAVDSLIHTREIIQYVCAQYGYRASLIPKPFDDECGSAAHMHMSFKPVDKQWNFFAGVLDEMRAVNALTLGGEMSYERVLAGSWAGGLWACWGRQNREAPIRLVEENKAHWEIKCVDGMANMYLAVAGVLTAGIIGVIEQRPIYGECRGDSSLMKDFERLNKGINIPMVQSMTEALEALFKPDGVTLTEFSSALGPGIASHLAAVKRMEESSLKPKYIGYHGRIDKDKRRIWAAKWY